MDITTPPSPSPSNTQSQKYWRCRYLLLPSEAPRLPPFYNSQERASRESSLISSFVRFLEFLNHIKRAPGQTPLVHKPIPFVSL